MSITLSDSAVTRVSAFPVSRGRESGLHPGMRASDHSGMVYVLGSVDKPMTEDTVFEDKGTRVVIDGKSPQFPNDTQLGFVKESLNEESRFTNPNAKDECGCDESSSA